MGNIIFEVGEYIEKFNLLTGQNLPIFKIVRSSGLAVHVQKRHPNCVKYLKEIPNIIKAPDYIGCNPKEPNSIELIKKFNENIQIAIKLDSNNKYYYVASIYEIKQGKIDKGLFSGRLKYYINI